MIRFLKTTRWWMYIPFACISFSFFDWVTDGYNSKERHKRLILFILNTIFTIIFISVLSLIIIIL